MTTANLKFLFGTEPAPETQPAAEVIDHRISEVASDEAYAAAGFSAADLDVLWLAPDRGLASDFDLDRLVIAAAGGPHAEFLLDSADMSDAASAPLVAEAAEPFGLNCEATPPSVISSDFVFFIG